IHHNLPAGFRQCAESETRPVGRNPGCQRNRTQARDLVLIRTVVVHRPDFLVTTPIAHEINLSLGYALNAAAQPKNDLVGELVRHDPRGGIARGVGILLAKDLWRLDILDVEEPALHGQLTASYAQVSKRQ